MKKNYDATVILSNGGERKTPGGRIIGMAITALLSMYLFSGCIWRGPHGESLMIIPPLPVSMELLDTDPYYYYGGYYYYYNDGIWFYSHSRGGPWMNLPRSHYPREFRFRNQSDGNGERFQGGDRYQGGGEHEGGGGRH